MCLSNGMQQYTAGSMRVCANGNWYSMENGACDAITVLVWSHSASYTFAGSGTVTFTLTNIGNLMSDSLTITQNNSNANYSIINDTCSGVKLNPNGGSCTLDVVYVHPPGTNQTESIDASDGIVNSPMDLSFYSCDFGMC